MSFQSGPRPRVLLLSLLWIGAGAGTAAWAQSPERPASEARSLTPHVLKVQAFNTQAIEHLARRLFYSMDLDKNGEVSRDEYDHTEGGGFDIDYSQLDRDRDGNLTWTEYLESVRHFHSSGPPKQTL